MQDSQPKLDLVENIDTGTIFNMLREGCSEDWVAYTQHSFIQQLADGSLPTECFQHYLIQLYLFSKHYSRAYALAVVKSEHLDDLREAAAHVDLNLIMKWRYI